MHPNDETKDEVIELANKVNADQEELAIRTKNLEDTIRKFNEQLRQMQVQAVFLSGKSALCSELLDNKKEEVIKD